MEDKTFAEVLHFHFDKQKDPIAMQLLGKYVHCHQAVAPLLKKNKKREEQVASEETTQTKPYELFLKVEGPLKPQTREDL